MENKKLIIDNSKAESQYSKNHNKYLPTPAVDELKPNDPKAQMAIEELADTATHKKVGELNLDERFKSELKKCDMVPDYMGTGYEYSDVLNAFKIATTGYTHHNHASFVALVEGERRKYFDPEKAGSLPRGVSLAIVHAFTDFLNKIK